MLEGDKEDAKVKNGWHRVAGVEALLNHHKESLQSSRWARSNREREEFVEKIVKWWNKQSFYGESRNKCAR